MTKCQRCNFNKARLKIRNNSQELIICDFCECPGDILIEPLEIDESKNEPEITYGRLHMVKKSKKISCCRECKKEILIGSKCYNQRKNISSMPFPLQTRLCSLCADILIKNGTEAAEK
jgi:hypothetical protein